MTGDERVRHLADAAAHRAVERTDPAAGRRRALVWAAAAVLLLCLAGASVYFVLRLGDLQGQVDAAQTDAGRLADQVEQLGGTPVVEPAAPGVRGADGRDGVDGVDGRDGQDGRDGRDGQPGDDGSDGEPGRAGTDGQPGVTPPCMAEPAQCRGVDGQPGAPGPAGPAGPPGPTCPPGYTAESRSYDPTPLTPGDGETWWVCVANEGQA